MNIINLNGFTVKSLKKGYYAVIKDKKPVYISKNMNDCIMYIQKKENN